MKRRRAGAAYRSAAMLGPSIPGEGHQRKRGRTMGGRWIVAGALIGLLAASRAEAARLGVTASRSELLYSSSTGNPSCSDLSKITDGSLLPLNIVLLTAVAPAGIPVDQLRYQSSFPKPALG